MNRKIDFDPLQQPDEVFAKARALLSECPVGHSSNDGGFWVVADRASCLAVLQDSSRFHVGGDERAVRIPRDPPGFHRPLMPPQDINPPIHRDFRVLVNPHLTPRALAAHEAGFRRIIGDLLDSFVASGSVDIATDVAKVFPPRLTFRELFGIDDIAELAQVVEWVTTIVYGRFRLSGTVLAAAQAGWNQWSRDLIAFRRAQSDRDDILGALVHGTVEDGRPLSELEIVGAIQVLTLGGFMTTSDAACNIVAALAADGGVEDELRRAPGLVAPFIEEVLRLDPPVGSRPRRCVADADISGAHITSGERVMVHLVAANRDPAAFAGPDRLDIHRQDIRHLTFGGGIHRCVGSSLARMTLRIFTDGLLERMRNIRVADGQHEHRLSVSGATWRLVDRLPINYDVVTG